MYQPEGYWIALLFMFTSMMCWGSWANTMKLTPGWAFQLFYWDYVIGIIIGSLFWGLTLGSRGQAYLSFFANIRQADGTHILFALLGGAVFNVANLLLVAAIDIAGLAVAFPIGTGLALVVGVLLNFAISPQGILFSYSAEFFWCLPPCRVRVLASRPLRIRENWSSELFGDYNPSTMAIRVWMRTAVKKDITSFGT